MAGSEQHTQFMTWEGIDRLIDYLVPKFRREFTAMVMVTRGGIVPGGLLADALDIKQVLTAAVDFPAETSELRSPLMTWPEFIQFPEPQSLRGRATLIVDDVWGSGRTITAVKNRVASFGAFPETCVLHFNPDRSLFGKARPDYFAEITNAFVVYPWETDRGSDAVRLPAVDPH